MPVLFAIAALIAIVATALAITRLDAVHALLYLVVSLLAVALALFALGAPYLAALEVIIYAGAILVLFVFVTMMLNLGKAGRRQERAWQPGRSWIGPGVLAALLLIELAGILLRAPPRLPVHTIGPEAVGQSLLGPYVVGVELASMLLLAGLVAAYHLGRGLVAKQNTKMKAGAR
ncbi:MAG TPA: NADH-quinone oxidoreductase subunit J [Terriglobales bacterium]|nr:NADH-quinone oxidoreductase subunit J [Terriglobales bacterium]